jgi:hypothetical protein
MVGAMDFDEWKLHLAAALERECWWDPGQGIEYVKETGEEDWRQLFEKGVSPDLAAIKECAAILAQT